MKERCKCFFQKIGVQKMHKRKNIIHPSCFYDEIYIKTESASFEKGQHIQTINFDGLPCRCLSVGVSCLCFEAFPRAIKLARICSVSCLSTKVPAEKVNTYKILISFQNVFSRWKWCFIEVNPPKMLWSLISIYYWRTSRPPQPLDIGKL